MNKLGMIVEVHQQVLHTAQGPCALIQRETNLEDPESVTIFCDPLGNISEKTLVEWIRKSVMLQGWLREYTSFDTADIFVDGAVPNHAENILQAIVPQISKEADVTTHL